MRICDQPFHTKWTLKYRASRDGFAAKDFHDKCDGISNTLTVIKTTKGYIFGGFTTKTWQSNGGYVTDPNAFLFSLINKDSKPFKVLCSDGGKHAINCDSCFGPCFGGNDKFIKDIFICSDSNIKQCSLSHLGYSYKHQGYLKDTEQAQSILAGSNYFQTAEIEEFASSSKRNMIN